MSVFQHPRRKPCALGSLSIPFSATLGSHQAAPHSVGPPVLTVVCMESNPCRVLFSTLFLVMSMADPTAWVSFIFWLVLRLLTLGLVTAPAVGAEHRCYLDIPFPCVDSMFGSHGHLLLSWPGRCQTFPWQLHYVHSSLQYLLCSAHVFCLICQCLYILLQCDRHCPISFLVDYWSLLFLKSFAPRIYYALLSYIVQMWDP